MSFTAQFHGECDNCGEQLKGTEVDYAMGSYLVHVVCPTTVPDVPADVCGRCFTELPVSGICGVCE